MQYLDTWGFKPKSTAVRMSQQYSNHQKLLAAIKRTLKLRDWGFER